MERPQYLSHRMMATLWQKNFDAPLSKSIYYYKCYSYHLVLTTVISVWKERLGKGTALL